MEGAGQTQALSLSGYLVISDLTPTGRPQTGRCTCKVREKPSRDVPAYMDELEPSFALKRIDLDEGIAPEGRQRAVQEMQKLLNLRHPNIVRYHRAFLYDQRLCYMTEFAECGTVHHLVFTVKERGQRLPDALLWHLFTQICQGLKKLHDAGITHRALKTRARARARAVARAQRGGVAVESGVRPALPCPCALARRRPRAPVHAPPPLVPLLDSLRMPFSSLALLFSRVHAARRGLCPQRVGGAVALWRCGAVALWRCGGAYRAGLGCLACGRRQLAPLS